MQLDVALFYESNGCRDTLIRENLITYQGPNNEFDLTIDGCSPDSLFLTDNSNGFYDSLLWEVFDNNTNVLLDSTSQISNPTFPVEPNRDYRVRFTIVNTNTGCFDTEIATVTTPPPLPIINASVSDSIVV